MITMNQMKKIYATANDAGIDNEELHLLIAGITGKDSVKKLTFAEANDVISELEERNRVPLPEKMTEAQRTKIWTLLFELERYSPLPENTKDGRIKRLTGIANRLFKHEPESKFYLNELTKAEASQLIDALNRYIRHARKVMGGDNANE